MRKCGKYGLGYQGGNQVKNAGPSQEEPILGQYFVRGSIAMLEDGPMSQMGWIYATKEGESNETPPIGDITLMSEDLGQLDELVEDTSMEAEALVDMEGWMERERPKFRP
ncbi:hypothetical protein CR513_48393, partial [Mucuna pruriens]